MRYGQKQRRRKLDKKLGRKVCFKSPVERGVVMGIPFTYQFGGLNFFKRSKGFVIGHIKGEPK